MQKTIVGDWGSELNDGDYACALAALGALQSTGTMQHYYTVDLVNALEKEFENGERTPLWRGAFGSELNTTPASWLVDTANKSAAELAAAWRTYRSALEGEWHERHRPRLAVELRWRERPDLFDFNDLCDWLNHDDVGLDALVLADNRKSDLSGPWHWPVHVGVPVGRDAEILAALRAAEQGYEWVKTLSRCYPVGSSRDWCDVLILTRDAADKLLSETRTRIRARFVACLWEPPSSHLVIPEIYGELRDRLRAVGLAVVGNPDNFEEDLSKWFRSVVHDLSHDVPIHAAVSVATRSKFNRVPLTIGAPHALDACRILALAKRHDHVADLLAKDYETDLPQTIEPPGGEPVFRGAPPEWPGPPATPPPPPAELPQSGLAEAFRKRQFTSESADGEQSVKDLNNREDEIDSKRSSRYIQANVWRPDAPERQGQSLASERWNLLKVHIGPTLRPRSDAPFPEQSVDFDRGEVAVTVLVELGGTELAKLEATSMELKMLSQDADRGRLMEWLFQSLPATPSTADSNGSVVATTDIKLPKIGDSSPALFAVRPQPRVREVTGRISIIHNNRTLQTATVSFPTDNAMRSARGIEVIAEAPIHSTYDDLEKRRPYDVTIHASDIGGKLHLMIEQDGVQTMVQLDDLSSPIDLIRRALHQATVTWDESASMLTHEDFRLSLYAMAANGSALEQHLRQNCGERIKQWERIQIVTATNVFLPLEYVYAGPPPRTTAQVCPNVLGALERGKCEQAVQTQSGFEACPNRQDKHFTCPMHFWGFRNLIERSSPRSEPSTQGQTNSKDRVPSKDPFGKVRGVLFAASDKAFKYKTDEKDRQAEREALVKALGAISVVSDATDWDDWCKKVETKPNLLLLIVHSEKFQGAPGLEIGDAKFLGSHEISEELSGTDSQPQLLVLLGCSVASVNEDFQPYPAQFSQKAKVKIVLAPIATIRGADAVPIARRIAQVVSECVAKSEPTAFGDFLPMLRRELLHDGHPGVMSIVGFGDGDWLLGGE